MYRNIEDFLNDWKIESEATIKVFSNISDAALNIKAHENIRSMAFLAWHITTTPGEMLGKAGIKISGPDEHSKPPKSIKEIIDEYKEVSTSVLNELTKWTNASLNDEINMYGEKWTKGKILSVLILHQTHHRAQLTILMRLAGLRVPGVYGPAKEDWALWNMPPMD